MDAPNSERSLQVANRKIFWKKFSGLPHEFLVVSFLQPLRVALD